MVHILFIPMLFWSFMVFVAHLPVIILFEQFPFNFSFALSFLFIFYYLLLEPVAGVCQGPLADHHFRPSLRHSC